ncbi:hypothetical protein OHT76_41220 [Streptomyces sp. NBC_00287]|uniref:hypothetical protein n=1 Tax=Streptomyces sp. NBC_00287 TaxID=2975702 RepID=UPI002E2991EF|nr:hypothetical protein [Streptomyces sp. NBC_00287]
MSVIADLERELSRRIADYISGSQESLAEALSVVARPSAFPRLIYAITRDEDRFSGVVHRSVVHPNGFVKIVLLSTVDYRLRLHVWRENGTAPMEFQESIHNHRWDFASTILAGAYRHQEYQLSETGEPFLEYRYQPAEDRRSYTLVPVGNRTLRCVFDARLAQGTGYSMTSVVLHRVVPDLAHPTVSLVLEGPHQPTRVKVFAKYDLGLKTSTSFATLAASSLKDHLDAVVALPVFSGGPA